MGKDVTSPIEIPNLFDAEDGILPIKFDTPEQAVTHYLNMSKLTAEKIGLIRQNLVTRPDMNDAERLFARADQIFHGTRVGAYQQMIGDYKSVLGLEWGNKFHEEMARQLFGKSSETQE